MEHISVFFDDGPELGLLTAMCNEDAHDARCLRFIEVHGTIPCAKVTFDDGLYLYADKWPEAAEGVLVDEDGDPHKYMFEEIPQCDQLASPTPIVCTAGTATAATATPVGEEHLSPEIGDRQASGPGIQTKRRKTRDDDDEDWEAPVAQRRCREDDENSEAPKKKKQNRGECLRRKDGLVPKRGPVSSGGAEKASMTQRLNTTGHVEQSSVSATTFSDLTPSSGFIATPPCASADGAVDDRISVEVPPAADRAVDDRISVEVHAPKQLECGDNGGTPDGGAAAGAANNSGDEAGSGEDGEGGKKKDAVLIERAKSSRGTCKICCEKMTQGSLRCGVDARAAGRTVTVWAHPACFLGGVVAEYCQGRRGKCKGCGEGFEKGDLRVSFNVGNHRSFWRPIEAAHWTSKIIEQAQGQVPEVSFSSTSSSTVFTDLEPQHRIVLMELLSTGRCESLNSNTSQLRCSTPSKPPKPRRTATGSAAHCDKKGAGHHPSSRKLDTALPAWKSLPPDPARVIDIAGAMTVDKGSQLLDLDAQIPSVQLQTPGTCGLADVPSGRPVFDLTDDSDGEDDLEMVLRDQLKA